MARKNNDLMIAMMQKQVDAMQAEQTERAKTIAVVAAQHDRLQGEFDAAAAEIAQAQEIITALSTNEEGAA